MAQRNVRAQVILSKDSAIPEDAAMNTWHFIWNDGWDESIGAAAVVQQMDDFYSFSQGSFATELASPITVKQFDLADPEPRQPFDVSTFSWTPGGASSLPAECAVALSYHGLVESGDIAARRRGRIFLGPLASGVGGVVNGEWRVNAASLTAFSDMGGVMLTPLLVGATATGRWALFSPTTYASSGVLDTSMFTVIGGHVDNAFDVIRSRGPLASTRSVF